MSPKDFAEKMRECDSSWDTEDAHAKAFLTDCRIALCLPALDNLTRSGGNDEQADTVQARS